MKKSFYIFETQHEPECEEVKTNKERGVGMRKIKFRAWDDVEERFWTLQDGGEESGDGSVQYFGNEQGVLEIGRLEEFDTGLGVNSQFTAFPLYQYTGLKDKNGREIYEGDVIQTNALKENEFRWLVEPIGSEHADGGRYGICVSYYGDGDNQYLDDGILKGEIIGNIYENPELLEVAK